VNAPNTRAAVFFGNVDVVGTLSKSAGSFKIDHPQDPANKYLVHSFVESPDMMNVYNGNIKTDASGKAIIQLPAYFQAENIEFKYQLTIVDETQFAMARVSKKIGNNEFEIMTDKPNIEVSWQVTGVRNDVYAQAHRIVPEVEKSAQEKGNYLHPELLGQPITKKIGPPAEGSKSIQGPAIDPDGKQSAASKGAPHTIPTGIQKVILTEEEIQAEKQAKQSGDNTKADELKKILEQKPVVPEKSKIKSDQGKIPPAETKPVETPAKLETAPAKSN
jgi:hypothetical protein